MLKKLALLLSTASLVGLYADAATPAEMAAAPSSMMEGFYLKAGVGYDWFTKPQVHCSGSTGASEVANSVKVTHAVPLSLAFGYRFDENWRTDLALTYRSSVKFHLNDAGGAAADGKFTNFTAMVNAYYDFAPMASFTPYLGAGVGMYSNNGNTTQWSGTGHAAVSETGATFRGLSWSLMAGVQYPVMECCDLELGYSFSNVGHFGTTGAFSNNTTGARIYSNNAYANELALSVIVKL